MIMNQIRGLISYISKNRLTSFISILGLSIGLSLTVYLTLFIKHELSYDRFHAKHDRIYRLLGKLKAPGQEPEILAICQGRFPEIANNIPEVESYLRILCVEDIKMEFENVRSTHNNLLYADSTFFNLFSFKILSGNPVETLKNPSGLLICKTLALKAFNTLDVIGKSVKVDGREITIGCVLDDIPSNSHLQFNLLCGSNNKIFKDYVKNSGNEFFTYILLKERVDSKETLDKVCKAYTIFCDEYWKGSDRKIEGLVQPLTDIELYSDNFVFDVQHGNIRNMYLAAALFLFILIVAIINVINLFTITAETHFKEAGVRKAFGASRRDIIKKYIIEAELITLLSLVVAMFIVKSFWPSFLNFIGENIKVSEFLDIELCSGLVLLCVIIGLASGIYPALYLSRFSLVMMFKGPSSEGRKISPLTKGMVLSQFFIVSFLISCLFIFYRQMNFIKNKDLGFDKECIVAIDGLNRTSMNNYSGIKEKLLQNSGILNVSMAQGIADNEMSGQYLRKVGDKQEDYFITKHTRTTEDFIRLFGIQIIEGRDFDKSFSTDKENFIINETAGKMLGFTGSAIGQRIIMNDTGTVIGVVKDFNFSSLHNIIPPLVITSNTSWGKFYVKLKPSFIGEGLDLIQQTIKQFDPLYNLDYMFVDDTFERMYLQEEKISKMLFTAVMISILLAIMGLVALTYFTIIRRIKEVGIRKVNGASIIEILILLNMEFIRWVLASLVFALPAAWIVMHIWLESFAFKTEMSWWIYALSGFSILISALITVTCICWGAATRNPVEVLRHE
jgi:putative ABC transport system permease protein